MGNKYHSLFHGKQYDQKVSTDKPCHLGLLALLSQWFLKEYHIYHKKISHQLFHFYEKYIQYKLMPL